MVSERNLPISPNEAGRSPLHFLSQLGAQFNGPMGAGALAGLALFVLALVLRVDLPVWLSVPLALAFMSATFWGWVSSLRRLQALEDVPLSKIGSAPQGYVRLEGRAAAFPGVPTECPLTERACCWYSYRIAEDSGKGGNEHDTSTWSFLMADGSGECVIDPVGARIIPVRVEKWRREKFEYTEMLILPGDPVFVVGDFQTTGSSISEAEIDFRVGQLIASWKQDMPALIGRFDLNGDRQFSSEEWERVRSQARRDVEADLARNPPPPQNIVSAPGDGRAFIISGERTVWLARDLKIWAWIHLSGFLFGVAFLVLRVLGRH